MPDTEQRLELMHAFADTYWRRRFDPTHYDLDTGYLQTTLSDDRRMPLRFFVEYNNAWWFEIVTAVDVPAVGYDPDSDSGFIVLDIRYDDATLRAMQHVRFGERLIDRIRTYASPTFFAGEQPLIALDRRGNEIWLETGYDLAASTTLADQFLQTEDAARFAAEPRINGAIERIRANLNDLRGRL